jgi:hypothetical protein
VHGRAFIWRLDLAANTRKPHLHRYARSKANAAPELKEWIQQNNIRVLNVAGPRASKEPGVAEFVISTLAQALQHDPPA